MRIFFLSKPGLNFRCLAGRGGGGGDASLPIAFFFFLFSLLHHFSAKLFLSLHPVYLELGFSALPLLTLGATTHSLKSSFGKQMRIARTTLKKQNTAMY